LSPIEKTVFRSHLVKTGSFLSLLALSVAAVFSQSPQPQTAQPVTEPPLQTAPTPTPTPTPETDKATLNLHRWGAVTIFHGMPSDRVNAITQDAKGLLWFGTDNGLVRYDGRNVEAFPGGLPSRRILALALDAGGDLLIGTDAGAARLHNNIPELLPESRGRAATGIASVKNEIAIVTSQGEILRYRQSDGKYAISTRIDGDSQPLLKSTNQQRQQRQQGQQGQQGQDKSLPLAAVSFTQSGELVIASSGRGTLINNGGDLREVAVRSPRPYFVSSVYAGDNRIWLGERSNQQTGALWVLANGSFSKSTIKTGAINALSGGDGELWVGTNKQGVYLVKPDGPKGSEVNEAKQIEHLTFENTAGGLRSNQINAIFRDREGIVWFGTDRGVCRYDRDSFRAENVSDNPQSNFIRSLLHTSTGSDGETYCGTNRGLFRLVRDESGGSLGAWNGVTELQAHSIYTLQEDVTGTIWAGTDSGVFIKPKDSPNFAHFSTTAEEAKTEMTDESIGESQSGEPPADSARTQSSESVRALTGFRGAIYAAVFGRGIEKFEATPERGKQTPILNNKTTKGVISLAAEGDKALWFGTIDGELGRFDGNKTSSFALPKKEYSDPGIRAIRISGGRVWLGTSQGLYLRDGGAIHEIKANIDVRDLFIQRDDHGREIIWLATQNSGLIKYIPGDEISARFDTEQGLTSEQVFTLAELNREIWIGTNRGIVRHRPSLVEPRIQAARLVADRNYEADDLTGELPLNYPQKHFLLEVTGIGTRTFLNQFQYEFLLQDSNGQQLSKFPTREPLYDTEELKPGAYTIIARSISRDLVYSAPLKVRVRIGKAPFPWPTILLTSLLGIAVAAAVWAFRQQRRLARVNLVMEETNTELHETRLRLAKETEAERSRIARDLHDQTLSDLRHLLVLTDQMRASNNDVSPSLLRRKIESISSEIRHICEDLSPSALENIGFLPALEWALNNAVANLPAEQKFSYEFISDPELEDRLHLSQIEKIQLYRIVQEALNNISRHARAREVKLIVRSEGTSELVIVIEDDGIGFDGTAMNPTGYGIANIRSRANLIGAQVAWKKMNPGCRFEVLKAGVVLS
jgi:signal transduction histidine kinase/ligand-binding sensor domain-containing protein